MTFIVRVSVSDFIFLSWVSKLQFFNNHGVDYLQALLKALVMRQPVRLLNVLAKYYVKKFSVAL